MKTRSLSLLGAVNMLKKISTCHQEKPNCTRVSRDNKDAGGGNTQLHYPCVSHKLSSKLQTVSLKLLIQVFKDEIGRTQGV